jgi:hypothetical protein
MKKLVGKSKNKRVTSNTKRVADVLIDWYRPGKGHSWASRETLANELGIAQSTVSSAIATLHDLGIIFTETGGFGAKANQYLPNFRLVLDPDTGSIIKNASYKKSKVSAVSADSETPRNPSESAETAESPRAETPPNGTCKPQTSADVVSDSEDSAESNPVSDNRTQEKSCNPQTSADVVSDPRPPYCVSNKRGAPASPTSPGGSAVGTPAHEKSLTRYILFDKLAENADLDREGLREAIAGKGSVEDQKNLRDVCDYLLHVAEGYKFGLFKRDLASAEPTYGHVVIHGDSERVSFIEGSIAFEALKQTSCLAIEYREA